jgi:uncharacterized membrane protein
MIKRIFLFLTVFATLFAPAFSGNYADIEIDIGKDGLVSITGPTNYPQLKDISNSAAYTSKTGEYWLFNLTVSEQFDEYIFVLNLPMNSQVNYIKAPENFRIENNNGRISIVGFAEESDMNIIVQYKISYIDYLMGKNTIILILSGMLVFMIIFSVTLLLKFNDIKKRRQITKDDHMQKDNPYDISLFTERQQEIIKLLEKHKKMTQKELEQTMKIPKSSISRNIRTLEIKGIISKERVGHTNYLIIK